MTPEQIAQLSQTYDHVEYVSTIEVGISGLDEAAVKRALEAYRAAVAEIATTHKVDIGSLVKPIEKRVTQQPVYGNYYLPVMGPDYSSTDQQVRAHDGI
jgi:hypothetical protein